MGYDAERFRADRLRADNSEPIDSGNTPPLDLAKKRFFCESELGGPLIRIYQTHFWENCVLTLPLGCSEYNEYNEYSEYGEYSE